MAPCMFLGIRCRMSRMKMRNRVGDSTPPCRTPCLTVLFLPKCCLTWTFAFLLHMYCSDEDEEHSPSSTTLAWFQFQTLFPHLVKRISRSIHTASVGFLSWKASAMAWEMYVNWYSVDRSYLNVACSDVICFLS